MMSGSTGFRPEWAIGGVIGNSGNHAVKYRDRTGRRRSLPQLLTVHVSMCELAARHDLEPNLEAL